MHQHGCAALLDIDGGAVGCAAIQRPRDRGDGAVGRGGIAQPLRRRGARHLDADRAVGQGAAGRSDLAAGEVRAQVIEADAPLREGEGAGHVGQRRRLRDQRDVVVQEADAALRARRVHFVQRQFELERQRGVALRARFPGEVADPFAHRAGLDVLQEVLCGAVGVAVDGEQRLVVTHVGQAAGHVGQVHAHHLGACHLERQRRLVEHHRPLDAGEGRPAARVGRHRARRVAHGFERRRLVGHVLDGHLDAEAALVRGAVRKIEQVAGQHEGDVAGRAGLQRAGQVVAQMLRQRQRQIARDARHHGLVQRALQVHRADLAGVGRVAVGAGDPGRQVGIGEGQVVAADHQFLLAAGPGERALQAVQRHARLVEHAGQQQRHVGGVDAQRAFFIGEDDVARQVFDAGHGRVGVMAGRDGRQRAGAERHLAQRAAPVEVLGRRAVRTPARDVALPVDVQVVEPARGLLAAQRFEHVGRQRQGGGDGAHFGEVERGGLDLQVAQRVAGIHRPAERDVAQAARGAGGVGRCLERGARQRGLHGCRQRYRLRRGRRQRQPLQRLEAQRVLAVGAALVRTQHLQAAHADRVQVLPDPQIDLLAGQAGLAAGDGAAGELHRAVGGERAAGGRSQDLQVALCGRQLKRVDLPIGLASPVVPIAGTGQQVVAEIGAQLDGAGEQRRRGGAGVQPVAGRAAAQVQADIAQRGFGQAVLLVEPAHRAFAEIDVALGQQLVEEGAVAAGARLHLDAGHRQGARGIAPDQHVGVAGMQEGKCDLQPWQRTPRQPGLHILYREGLASGGVARLDALGAEGRVPAFPVGFQRADADLGLQGDRGFALHPLARQPDSRPQDEPHQQHAGHGQHGQHDRGLPEQAPQLAPDRRAHHGPDAGPDVPHALHEPGPCPRGGRAHAGPGGGQGAGGSAVGLR